MTNEIFLAADLSGIQRFVLRVKTAGKAQAKRLRARSFLLEMLEIAALKIIGKRFRFSEDDILIRGGGGFLVRIPSGIDIEQFEALDTDLQHRLWEDFGGEIHLTLGWGKSAVDARKHIERRKRRPARAMLQDHGVWDVQRWSRAPIDEPFGKPCDVCGEFPGRKEVVDEERSLLHCASCLDAREIGGKLTRHNWIRVGAGSFRVLGVEFELLNSYGPEAWRIGRWIPRKPKSDEAMTFEELSRKSRGDSRLAVLKADVDDMGLRVAEIANGDTSCNRLRAFSRHLHEFFVEHVQDMIEQRWPSIYTLYAGGDDLLLVGPWDVILGFAGALAHEFQAGPARSYGPLTLSAGIALTPYRVPIRHAVERAEELLDSAKQHPGKNRCVALDGVWTWDRHGQVVRDGQMIAESVSATGGVARGMLHRLLRLVESNTHRERNLRAARWSYQIARNFPRQWRGEPVSVLEFRRWAQTVLVYLESDEQRIMESAASLRYALLATRSKTGGRDG